MELALSLFGTAKLGSVIGALERAKPDADVIFDFCYLRPTTVDSYRGYYNHLALGWTDKSVTDKDGKFIRHWPAVSDVLAELKAAVGKSFEGWKGGDYTMRLDTPLWIANRGEGGGTGIVDIEIKERTVLIKTAKVN